MNDLEKIKSSLDTILAVLDNFIAHIDNMMYTKDKESEVKKIDK